MAYVRRIGLLLLLVLLLPVIAACGSSTGGSQNTTTTSPATAAPTTGSAATATTGGAMMTTTADTMTTATSGAMETMTAGAMETTTAGSAMTTATAGMDHNMPGMDMTATAGSADMGTPPPALDVEPGAQLTLAAGGSTSEQALIQQSVDRFNKLYQGKATLTFNPVAADYQTKTKADFTAGTQADINLIDGELMGALAPNGLLLPLDDAMAQSNVKAGDFIQPLIQLYQIDGKTYAIPKDFNPLVLFVNEDLAQQAGVDAKSIKTWDDLKAAAKKLTSGEGPGKKFGMCLNPDIQRYGAAMFQNGNSMIENNKSTFNDEKGVAAIDFWYSFKKDGTGELYKELGNGWCGESFAKQTSAMVVEGGWLLPFMADPANGANTIKYTAVPLPTPAGGQQATWLFTNGWGAAAKSKYPKAAAAAVVFLTSDYNQRALIPSGLALPSRTSLANDPYYGSHPLEQTLVQVGPTGQLADTKLGGPVKKGDVLDALNKALERIFTGQQATKESLDQAAQQVDEILAQQ